MRFDAEAWDPTVNHEVYVRNVVALTPREGFWNIEKLSFEIIYDALNQLKRHIGIVNVDVGARFA